MAREFVSYSWKNAGYRICSAQLDVIKQEIRHQRSLLEEYIRRFPGFRSALSPISPILDPPEIAMSMIDAAARVGVGPMAAVAGAIAEWGARAAIFSGADEAIVENGGDIYLHSKTPVVVSIFTGTEDFSHDLAFRISPEMMPLSICSSSAAMGRSISYGKADLVTVVSKNAALADAAATALCNAVQGEEDIQPALEKGISVDGVDGVLIVVGEKIGLIGKLPELIRQKDPEADIKITGIATP